MNTQFDQKAQFTATNVERWNKSRERLARTGHDTQPDVLLRFHKIRCILERALLAAAIGSTAFVLYRIGSAFLSGRISEILSAAHLAAR